MSHLQILKDLKENVVVFLDELIEQFPEEADFIILRLVVQNKIQPETLLQGFVKEVLPFKSQIENKDEAFFLESNLSIFNSLDKSKVNHFKLIWKSDRLMDDDRQTIWAWMNTFVFLTEQYQKAISIQK